MSTATNAPPTPAGPFEIRSQASGPHWIAWIERAGNATPDRGIVLVGETQAEAEARARRFADESQY